MKCNGTLLYSNYCVHIIIVQYVRCHSVTAGLPVIVY